MNDPYLEFKDENDKSNIQVNIYHVKGELRNKTSVEKDKYLHNEVRNSLYTELDFCKLPTIIVLKYFFSFMIYKYRNLDKYEIENCEENSKINDM